MKQTHAIKCTICRWHSAEKIEDILKWVHCRVGEVEVEMKICQIHTTEDVRAFIDRCILFENLYNITCKVTKLDVTEMNYPEKTIDLVKSKFNDTLRHIILNIGGREVNLFNRPN